MTDEERVPFHNSASFLSEFIVGVDWEPAGTIGWDTDEPLHKGRGWFTPAEARQLAAILNRRANELDPDQHVVTPWEDAP